MYITGEVMNRSIEDRELTGKDGTKRRSKVSHVLLCVRSKAPDGKDSLEIVNLRSYDAEWALPEIGTKWTTPRIRRYENFDGNVAEVSV